ncbi:MAG: head GIN domain-containing protein [Leeuwenhoekiella sp.]
MKNIKLLIVLFISGFAVAQNPRVQDVGDFNEVKVFDRMKVNLIKADENKVVISGQDIDDIELINKDGLLKIRMNIDKIFDGDHTFVEVHYKYLNVIDGNEGAEIVSNELIEQDRITLKSQEGAHIKAGLKVDFVDMRAVTGGILEVSGTATKQKIEVNTGGIFEGRDLHTEETEVRVQAGGEANIYASKLADVKIRAGGDVRIYGDPEEVLKDNFIGGRIKVM